MNNQPGRGGPITLIILSIVAMIGAPIVGFAIAAANALSGLDTANVSQSQMFANGGTVSVASAGDWAVLPQSEASVIDFSCTVTDETGTALATTSPNGFPVFTTQGSGTYTIDCTTSDSSLMIIPSGMIDGVVDNLGGIAGWAIGGLVVGFLGLIGLIVGIVWLVGVNRKRREAAAAAQYGGGYGGGGYGGQTPYGGAPYSQQPNAYGQSPYGQQPPQAPQSQVPPQYGQTPQQYGAQPTQTPQYGENVPQYGENTSQTPPSVQNPAEPPRYGERIDPYTPPAEDK